MKIQLFITLFDRTAIAASGTRV